MSLRLVPNLLTMVKKLTFFNLENVLPQGKGHQGEGRVNKRS